MSMQSICRLCLYTIVDCDDVEINSSGSSDELRDKVAKYLNVDVRFLHKIF